jgi:hypothetical protein
LFRKRSIVLMKFHVVKSHAPQIAKFLFSRGLLREF